MTLNTFQVPLPEGERSYVASFAQAACADLATDFRAT